MKRNWYSIYPGPDGLNVLPLGQFDNFDEVDEADRNQRAAEPREPTIWLLDLNELMVLEDNIRKVREIS